MYNALSDIFEKFPKVVNSTDLIKLSRTVSYMTFILKECCDYYMAKTSNNTPVYKIKMLNEEINTLKAKCERIGNFLK
jgi:hypothetical protein